VLSSFQPRNRPFNTISPLFALRLHGHPPTRPGRCSRSIRCVGIWLYLLGKSACDRRCRRGLEYEHTRRAGRENNHQRLATFWPSGSRSCISMSSTDFECRVEKRLKRNIVGWGEVEIEQASRNLLCSKYRVPNALYASRPDTTCRDRHGVVAPSNRHDR
jgi:hypothetical protein